MSLWPLLSFSSVRAECCDLVPHSHGPCRPGSVGELWQLPRLLHLDRPCRQSSEGAEETPTHTHTSYFLSSGVGLMIFESGMHFDFEKAKALPCRHRSPHRAPSSLIPSRYMQEREPRVVKSRRHGMLSSERLASFGRSSACLPAASPSLARSFHWSVAKSNTHNSDCTMQICNMLTARAALTIPCLRSLVAL